MATSNLTAARLRELLDYDRGTGVFTNRVRRNNNGSPIGHKTIGAKGKNGYLYIGVCGLRCLSHRLAWLHVYGVWPEHDIDHINGLRDDNRLVNLRVATRAENLQNQQKAKSNNKSSGFLGVYRAKGCKRFTAAIKSDGKRKHLGLFDTPQEAHAAYMEAKLKMHPFAVA